MPDDVCRLTHRVSRRRLAFLAAGLASAAASGCDLSATDRILVATKLPAAERRRLESDFREWQQSREQRNIDGTAATATFHFLVLGDRDDPAKLAERRIPPDVWLESSVDCERIPAADFPDPRANAAIGEWAVEQLARPGFREGYARLVRLAGAPASGRAANLKTAGEDRGSARSAALVALRHEQSARRFLRFLAETRGVRERAPGSPSAHAVFGDPAVGSLVCDLLGATLVDARDELWGAWTALEKAAVPKAALERLLEPPSWPPVSVARYLRQGNESAMALLTTLAAELAPDPPARAWLLASWLAPSRPLDPELFVEMAHAADGRLGREPRFRAWLAAEWTASARQRYRRVARLAALGAAGREGTGASAATASF
jgi:hypothetical protein